MKLDIGGGLAPREGFTNLDPVHGQGKWKRKIQDGIPLLNGMLEEANASHVLEHIPSGDERIWVMNEVWRVLRPGGRFHIRVPLFPSWQAVADPTHVSFWVKESFDYFTKDAAQQADYGIKEWVIETYRAPDWEAYCVLVKP